MAIITRKGLGRAHTSASLKLRDLDVTLTTQNLITSRFGHRQYRPTHKVSSKSVQ